VGESEIEEELFLTKWERDQNVGGFTFKVQIKNKHSIDQLFLGFKYGFCHLSMLILSNYSFKI